MTLPCSKTMLNKQNQLERAVRNALRAKVAASAAHDTSSAAFLDAEKLCITAEETYYKSDAALDRARLALSNYLKEQDK